MYAIQKLTENVFVMNTIAQSVNYTFYNLAFLLRNNVA